MINLGLIQLTNIKYRPSNARCYGKIIQKTPKIVSILRHKNDFFFFKARERLDYHQDDAE